MIPKRHARSSRLSLRRGATSAVVAALMVGGALLVAWSAAADERQPPPQRTAKEALGEFNGLIGGWRGVGMPRRGSRDGAWSETADWVWEFKEGGTGLRYTVKQGKLLRTALLTYDPPTGNYHLRGTLADETERTYSGRLDGNKLVLESSPDDGGEVHRLTLTQLNEKRTLVLYERRPKSSRFASRIAEVGYTRQGTSLAEEGQDGPECIVTGGKGTIKVMHKGETYWVCCTGCKQAFDADPEGTLAEYRRTLAERKAKP